jgi:hypothetical protein
MPLTTTLSIASNPAPSGAPEEQDIIAVVTLPAAGASPPDLACDSAGTAETEDRGPANVKETEESEAAGEAVAAEGSVNASGGGGEANEADAITA